MYRRKIIVAVIVVTIMACVACKSKDNNNENEIKRNTEIPSNYETILNEVETNKMDDYDLMMTYIKQIKSDYTSEQVIEIMGEPDEKLGSGIVRNYYNFGTYRVQIIYASDGLLLDIIDNSTGEKIEIY